MTRKDYIKLASAINAVINYQPRVEQELKVIDDLIYAIAFVLKADNDNFDRARFANACKGVKV